MEESDILQQDIEQKGAKVKLLKPSPNPIAATVSSRGWNGWDGSEYNFLEVVRIPEIESIVLQAFMKKESLLFKEGAEFIGKNPRTVTYIKNRLKEFEMVSSVSTNELLYAIGSGMIRSSNSFLALSRNEDNSSGKTRVVKTTYGSKVLQPISAIYPIPIETIEFKRDKQGRLDMIRQSSNLALNSKEREFRKDNFIHFFVNRRAGSIVGTPILIPVLDDIRAFRRLEQNVEIMTYQYLSPLYKYRVGNEAHPQIATYADGMDEISAASAQWHALPSDGAMVMPWWHDIDVIGAKNHAMDPIPLLEYYLQRILFGLGVSPVDIGKADTSNRATADNMSRIIIDSVKFIQRGIEQQFLSKIIIPLLYESPFSDQEVFDEQNLVYLSFKEIDVDTQIKRENHAVQLYSGHGITSGEFRHMLGREPLTPEEEEDTFFQNITVALEEMKASNTSAQMEQKAEALSSGQRAAKAATQPENQYGKKLGPEKRQSSFGQVLQKIRGSERLNFLPIKDVEAHIEEEFDTALKKAKMDLLYRRIAAGEKMSVDDMVLKMETKARILKDSIKRSVRESGKDIQTIIDSHLYMLEGFDFLCFRENLESDPRDNSLRQENEHETNDCL